MAEDVLKISGKTIEISEVSGEVFEIGADQFWIRTGDGHESTYKVPGDVPVPRVTHDVSVVYAGNEKTDTWHDCILVNRTTREWHFIADVGGVFRAFFSTTGSNLFVWLPILLVVLFFLSVEKESSGALLVGVALIFVYGIPATLIARAAANSKGKQLQRKLERYADSLLE